MERIRYCSHGVLLFYNFFFLVLFYFMDNSTFNVTDNTIDAGDDVVSHDSTDEVNYLIFTFASFLLIFVLTVIVVLLMQRKRKIDRLRHHLMPFYNFAPGEEEDWETELLDADERESFSRRDYSTFSNYEEQHL